MRSQFSLSTLSLSLLWLFSLSGTARCDLHQTWRIVNESVPDYYTYVVKEAFNLIERNSRYKFTNVGKRDVADIKVYLMDNNEPANSSRLGYAWPGRVFLNVDRLNSSAEALYSVAIHEIKHALGFGHDYLNVDSIMYPYYVKPLPFNQSLSVYDRFKLKRFVNKRYKKQCFDRIDSISHVTPYTWIAFRRAKYYRIDTPNGNARWNLISDLFPFRIPHPRVDSFFRLNNGTYGVVSRNDYWLFNYLPEEVVVVAKGLVNETFTNETSTVQISAAMGYENGLLVISGGGGDVFLSFPGQDGKWVRSNRSLAFNPLPSNNEKILGLYSESEHYIVILVTDGRFVYSSHDLELHVKLPHTQSFPMCPPDLLLSSSSSCSSIRCSSFNFNYFEMILNLLIVWFRCRALIFT